MLVPVFYKKLLVIGKKKSHINYKTKGGKEVNDSY